MIALALALTASIIAQVDLRGGAVLDEPVLEVSIEGVLLGGESPRMIGWDRARHVRGQHAEESQQFASIADDAWRARTRLARGDYTLAAPLFNRLFTVYRNQEGPTALVVAEGLMRCRLAEGDYPGALAPWLVALRLRRDGQRLVGEPPIPPLIEDETGLVPTLAPIFDSGRPAAISPPKAGIGEITALSGWYNSSWSGAPYPTSDPDEAGPGVALVARIVLAQSVQATERSIARDWLESQLESHANGAWREAWLRCAIGLSLLADEDPATADQAILHLSHLPARFRSTQPQLVAVALVAMIEHFEKTNEFDRARLIAEDLRAVDPDHPALRASRAPAN